MTNYIIILLVILLVIYFVRKILSIPSKEEITICEEYSKHASKLIRDKDSSIKSLKSLYNDIEHHYSVHKIRNKYIRDIINTTTAQLVSTYSVLEQQQKESEQ